MQYAPNTLKQYPGFGEYHYFVLTSKQTYTAVD